MKKIMFFMDWGVAMQYLEPLYLYLKEKEPTWELFFVANDEGSSKILDEKGFPRGKSSDEYDWAVCCDKLSGCPKKNRVVIFHGIASKGQEFCVNNRNVNPGDISVVASEYYKKLYVERDGAMEDKVIAAGITKFDTIKELPPKNEIPRILYAPTHNIELCSIPVLGESIYSLQNLTVHLHFYTRKSPNAAHEPHRQAMHDHNPIEDITEMMVNSDIVIADLGSTVLEALALGKMVIQIKNPAHWEWYKKRINEEQIPGLPEIDLPNRFAFQAYNIDGVKAAIAEYPNYRTPNFPIIENIGNFQTSKIIYEKILSR